MNKIYKIYQQLFDTYGPQGWWPILDVKGEAIYHLNDYSYPRDSQESFEVCIGSILTQNTTFTSVVTSLRNLQGLDALSCKGIQSLDSDILKEAIRPSGYFNQKAGYLMNFTRFYEELKGDIPAREALLAIKGIGEETADSILLYGYNQLEFKIDAYTKRVLMHLGFVDDKAKYRDMKELMQKNLLELGLDQKTLLMVYQEFHALIVCHAKQFYSKKPYGEGCFLHK